MHVENSEKTILQKGKEKIEEAIFNEKKFISYINDLKKDGVITSEKEQIVLNSLQESDAKARLSLWMKLSPLVLTVSYVVTSVIGGVAVSAGAAAALKTYLYTEIPLSIGRNAFVRNQGKGISDKNRLGNIAMIPFGGHWGVPLSLYRKHPELVELYLSYSASKRYFRKKERFEEDSPEYQVARYRIRKRFEKVKNGVTLKVIKGVARVLSSSSKKLKDNGIKESVSIEVGNVISKRNTFMTPGTY